MAIVTIQRKVTLKSQKKAKGAHIILPKFLVGRSVRIDFPDQNDPKKKLSDIQKVKEFGHSGHVYVPSFYAGLMLDVNYVTI